jgi:hypothetical protein
LREVCRAPDRLELKLQVKTVFLTFNSDAPLPDELRPVGVEEGEAARALGAMLLWSAGMGQAFSSKQLRWLKRSVESLDDAVIGVRNALELDAKGVLLVCVDELVRMSDSAQRGQVLAAAMRCMNRRKTNTVFVFSALVAKDVQAWNGNTGRRIANGVQLSLLDNAAALKAVRLEAGGNAARLLDQPAVRKILLQCCGHPRAVFDFFLPALRELHDAHPQGDIPAAALSRISGKASQRLRVPDELTVELVQQLVSPAGRLAMDRQLALQRSGLMVHASVLPIFLREWAYKEMHNDDGTKAPLAMHINNVYEIDQVVTTGAEKFAEGVFLHWDAARRVALGTTACSLQDMFGKDCRIKTDITGQVRVCPLGQGVPLRVIAEVQSFKEEWTHVLQLLHRGYVVVSKLTTEASVEYLAPLWTDESDELLVLGVQVKFEPKGSTFAVLAEKVQSTLGALLKGVKDPPAVISLILTTHHTQHTETPANSICFDLGALPAYLGLLGPLRLLLEKGVGEEKDNESPA